jgi:hypothetical protein
MTHILCTICSITQETLPCQRENIHLSRCGFMYILVRSLQQNDVYLWFALTKTYKIMPQRIKGSVTSNACFVPKCSTFFL